MKTPETSQITLLLESISTGDRLAVDQLFQVVYAQLHSMAKARMAHEPGQTLQTTDLVHEVYLRLFQDEQPRWENRRHFFACAAEAIRRILVENARRRSSLKRGAGQRKIVFDENMVAVQSDPQLLLAMDQALARLQVHDPVMSEVVKLRCFAGLTVKETSLALGTSPRNVDRNWAAGKAWLYREIIEIRR